MDDSDMIYGMQMVINTKTTGFDLLFYSVENTADFLLGMTIVMVLSLVSELASYAQRRLMMGN